MTRRPKIKEEDTPPGCPEWMVTFADVTSLLVTFFVFILIFSSMEKQQFQKLAGSLQGSFGVVSPSFKSNRPSLVARELLRVDREREVGGKVPFVRDLDDLEDEFQELKVKKRMENELRIDQTESGLRIRIDADRLFDPLSEDIREEIKPVIREIAEVLAPYPHPLLVEGHTDGAFLGEASSSGGGELAGAMAIGVAKALIASGCIEPSRVGVASYGASRPVASNDTAWGRARNRRVEIVLYGVEKE